MMRAARFYAAKDIRIDDVEIPTAKDNHVLIKVAYCGICGTDVHEYTGGPVMCPDTCSKVHPVTKEKAPVTMGHEFSGAVVGLGKDVNTTIFKVGQNVAVEPTAPCGKCYSCNTGNTNVCPELVFIGLSGWGGGLTNYVNVRQDLVYVLPENVSLESGALVEPLAVAWHAVKRGNPLPTDNVLIVGAGPIGCLLTKCLKARGVKWVAVSEPTAQRGALAKKAGADVVFNPNQQDVVIECRKVGSERGGVDVSFDAAGNNISAQTAIAAVRPRGNIVNVALRDNPVTFDMNQIAMWERTYIGTMAYSKDHEEVIKALSERRIVADDLITGIIDVEDVVEKGFKSLLNETDKHIKILVRPSALSNSNVSSRL